MKIKKTICSLFVISLITFISSNFVYAKSFWPPELNKEFPDVELVDQEGSKLRISDFKGSILLIEYVGMNCPACQAFSGANTKIGPYQNNAVQKGVKAFEEFCPLYSSGVKLSDERITFIQILLYDMKLGAPTPEDARKWAEHFEFHKSDKKYVTVPTKDLRGKASYNLIPGFQLVDKNLVLRSDSTGHNPRQNLWDTLLPMLPRLLHD